MINLLLILTCYLMANSAFAISFGEIAENIQEPIEIVSGFVSVGCLLIGTACLFAAIVKYFEHRRSPLHVPLSTVIWLVIIGILLLCLPFAYIVTGNGIPFTVLWGGGSE